MNPIIGLSLGRIVVGLLFFLRPDLAARMLGQDLDENPELALGARLFGSRDVALGAATLLAKGTARRNLVVAGSPWTRRTQERPRSGSRTSPSSRSPPPCSPVSP